MSSATAPAAAGFTVNLSLTGPAGKTKTRQVPAGEYLIGRSSECQIRINASESKCSRNHARLVLHPAGCFIEDLESITGTMVNGVVINKQELGDGDVVAVVGHFIRIGLPEQATAPATTVFGGGAGEEVDTEAASEIAEGLKELRQHSLAVLEQMSRRIVGQEDILRGIWATIISGGHCLLVGVPGLAKTFMVTSFAEVLGLRTKRIQFTPDLMPSDIIGANVLNEDQDGKRHFEFIQGPIFTQLLLADEINRTPPKTQAALLEAMQERQVTVGNKSLRLPDPFCVIASQNPIEQEGTYPLPEAQQDRFMVCLDLTYPDRDDEVEVLLRTTTGDMAEVEQVIDFETILHAKQLVHRIGISKEAARYAVDLVRATRPGCEAQPEAVRQVIDWGAGPRAGQALLRGAKALAAMDGRPQIARADVREMCLPVLRHRIGLNYRAKAEGMSADDCIRLIVEAVSDAD